MESPDPDDDGQPMRKPYRLMANFPLPLMEVRCRDGVVSPMARAGVLAAGLSVAAVGAAAADSDAAAALNSRMLSSELSGIHRADPFCDDPGEALLAQLRASVATAAQQDKDEDEDRTAAGDLYHLLLHLTRASALDRVVNAGEMEGLEAWRSLVSRYDPKIRSRAAGQLLELLNHGAHPRRALCGLCAGARWRAAPPPRR